MNRILWGPDSRVDEANVDTRVFQHPPHDALTTSLRRLRLVRTKAALRFSQLSVLVDVRGLPRTSTVLFTDSGRR